MYTRRKYCESGGELAELVLVGGSLLETAVELLGPGGIQCIGMDLHGPGDHPCQSPLQHHRQCGTAISNLPVDRAALMVPVFWQTWRPQERFARKCEILYRIKTYAERSDDVIHVLGPGVGARPSQVPDRQRRTSPSSSRHVQSNRSWQVPSSLIRVSFLPGRVELADAILAAPGFRTLGSQTPCDRTWLASGRPSRRP